MFKGLDVQRSPHSKRTRNVVHTRVGIQVVDEPEPLLRIAQRGGITGRTLSQHMLSRWTRLYLSSELAQCWRRKQRLRRHIDAQSIAECRHHLERQQRISAKQKEVVVRAYLVSTDVEYGAPHATDKDFEIAEAC